MTFCPAFFAKKVRHVWMKNLKTKIRLSLWPTIPLRRKTALKCWWRERQYLGSRKLILGCLATGSNVPDWKLSLGFSKLVRPRFLNKLIELLRLSKFFNWNCQTHLLFLFLFENVKTRLEQFLDFDSKQRICPWHTLIGSFRGGPSM